ncbi:MAG TPA: hypothetical protein VGI39_39085 [Polyangiaceae bacterium]|jgi:hypothetical protein
MSVNAYQGNPLVGHLSLTNGAPSAAIPIFAGGRDVATAYVLGAKERICVVSLAITADDATPEVVTITDNSTTNPTVLFQGRVSTTSPIVMNLPVGVLFGYPGLNLKATAASVTAGKTIEISLIGLVTKM